MLNRNISNLSVDRLVDSTSGTLYLVLCSLTRFLAGSGAAMLTVAAITLLLKVTSYSSSFVIVSISDFITMVIFYSNM